MLTDRQGPRSTWGSLVWAESSHQRDGKTHYLLDGPSVIAEYNGLGVVTEQHNNNPQRIDEQFDLVQSGTKLWPICDGLGSAYVWVDRSGNVVGSYSYDVYGARTQTSGSVNVAWGYTGREHDADTGLNYNRDRYLAPGLATWTQADRWGMRSGDGPNGYAYARLQPVNRRDPTGMATPLDRAMASISAEAMFQAGIEFITYGLADSDSGESLIAYGTTLVAIGLVIKTTLASSCPAFNAGKLWSMEATTNAGQVVTLTAKITTAGKTLTLEGFSMMGVSAGDLGVGNVRVLLNEIGQQAAKQGFETVFITGERMAGAGAGKAFEIILNPNTLEAVIHYF